MSIREQEFTTASARSTCMFLAILPLVPHAHIHHIYIYNATTTHTHKQNCISKNVLVWTGESCTRTCIIHHISYGIRLRFICSVHYFVIIHYITCGVQHMYAFDIPIKPFIQKTHVSNIAAAAARAELSLENGPDFSADSTCQRTLQTFCGVFDFSNNICISFDIRYSWGTWGYAVSSICI